MKHSFGDSVRATAYLVLGTLVIALILLRGSQPPASKQATEAEKPNIKGFFSDPPYAVILLKYVMWNG